MIRKCYRTGKEIEQPVEKNAHYVQGEDMVETVEKERLLAVEHTDESRSVRDEITELAAKEAEKLDDEDTDEDDLDTELLELANMSEAEVSFEVFVADVVAGLDTSDVEFDVFRIEDYEKGKYEENSVGVINETVEVEKKRQYLICKDALKDSDEIIW